jgi:Phage integrase family
MPSNERAVLGIGQAPGIRERAPKDPAIAGAAAVIDVGDASRTALENVDLAGRPNASPPVPPSIAVWRSVRASGDTKTKLSRRTLALPARCVEVLLAHRTAQQRMRAEPGAPWIDLGLVFTTRYGTPLDAADVRRDFRTAIREAEGIDPKQWTPRELRHSFVSLLSDSGVPIEEISRLVGHRSTLVTETVYRKQLRPIMQSGATAMDRLFTSNGSQFGSQRAQTEPKPGASEAEPGSDLG